MRSSLSALDRRLKLTDSPNAEIAHVWFRLAIANRYTAAYPAMERYMVRIGRRKLIVPLYRDLATTPEGKVAGEENLRTGARWLPPGGAGYRRRAVEVEAGLSDPPRRRRLSDARSAGSCRPARTRNHLKVDRAAYT